MFNYFFLRVNQYVKEPVSPPLSPGSEPVILYAQLITTVRRYAGYVRILRMAFLASCLDVRLRLAST
jgi:hypothetical protein